MTRPVDTGVWVLALRRNGPSTAPAVPVLHEALLGAEAVVTTGFVLQELDYVEAGRDAYDEKYRRRVLQNLNQRAHHLGFELSPQQPTYQ